MTRRELLLAAGLVFLLLVGVGFYFWIQGRKRFDDRDRLAAKNEKAAKGGASRVRRSEPAAPSGGYRRLPTQNPPLSPSARMALLGLLHRARQRRVGVDHDGVDARPRFGGEEGGRARGGGGGGQDGDMGTLDKEYIQDRVREVVPLVKECYDLALHNNPQSGGKLVVRFVMGGEPEIGGVVEESEVVEMEGFAPDSRIRECVRETMYALDFDPPSDGGRVTVTYPFTFRPKAED